MDDPGSVVKLMRLHKRITDATDAGLGNSEVRVGPLSALLWGAAASNALDELASECGP